ncbi:zinc-ribbon domain-containing protein, partial [Streptomyces ossamyceticus]
MTERSMTSYCPHCGTPGPDDARYCMKCGRVRCRGRRGDRYAFRPALPAV